MPVARNFLKIFEYMSVYKKNVFHALIQVKHNIFMPLYKLNTASNRIRLPIIDSLLIIMTQLLKIREIISNFQFFKTLPVKNAQHIMEILYVSSSFKIDYIRDGNAFSGMNQPYYIKKIIGSVFDHEFKCNSN